MRPELLNPIFAEVTALKGIGPQLAKPLDRLGLHKVVDILFHLPTGYVDRLRVDGLRMSDAGRVVTIELTPMEYRASGGRGPFRVWAADTHGDLVALVYFGGNPGWAKKQLPLGEPRIVSGKLEAYGQELQIVHPDYVLKPEDAEGLPERESVYPLSDGLTGRRMQQLAAQALERAPDLPEWIEASLHAQKGWPGWHEAIHAIHADPADARARMRLAYDEVFANQLALMLVRASSRRRRGLPLHGDGRLRAMLTLPYALTGAQQRTIREIEGDLVQSVPMVRLLQEIGRAHV